MSVALSSALRHHRHVLADVGAGDLGGDRLEIAADVGRRVGLGIPDVDVAGPALQEDHDHGLGAPKPRAPSNLVAAFAVFCQARKFARFSPSIPMDPARSSSRRVGPSQV